MRKVIYLGFRNPKTHKRGVENIIEIQARSLPRATRKFYIFFDDRPAVFRWNDIVCIGVAGGATRFFRLNAIVSRLFRSAGRSDDSILIHSHHYQMSSLLLRGTDIFTVHDGLWYLKKCFESRAAWMFWVVERLAYRRARKIHCNSRFTYRASQLPDVEREAKVIYCTTPMESYAIEERSYAASSPDGKIVFAVRSMEARARIDLILAVARLASQRGHRLDFVIAGKGPLLEQYREEVRSGDIGNVQLLGYVADEELAARYRDCDCVLVTCENGEGFGLPIIEGYLFGKPVVASNRCAIPEVIVGAEFLAENDPEAMLEHILAAQAYETSPQRFVSHYEESFSNRVILEQFAAMYEGCFAEAARRSIAG